MKKLLIILWVIGFFIYPVIPQETEKPPEPKENTYEDIRAFLKAQGDMMENFIKISADADTPQKAAKTLHKMVDDMEKTIPLIKSILKNHHSFTVIMGNPPEEADPEKKRIQSLNRDMAESFNRMLQFKEDGLVKEALERLKQFQIDTKKMIRDGSEAE